MIGSGLAVLCALLAMLYATAYLRSGHPPASGIVVLGLLLALSPVTLAATVLGFWFGRGVPRTERIALIMTGVNLAFAFLSFGILFFKVVLGAAL